MPTSLHFQPAIEHLDLVSPTVAEALRNWKGTTPVEEILVAEINSSFTHSAEFIEHYGFLPTDGANTVVVEAVRGGERNLVACVAQICNRMDLNKAVRKHLGVQRVSLAPKDEVLEKSQMEYGAVNPIGLPEDWSILIEEGVLQVPRIIVGAGLIKAKLSVPTKLLAELPNAQVLKFGIPI